MLVSVLLIVSGAPLTTTKVRSLEIFNTETIDMCFSAEEKEPASESKSGHGGSLRMRRCNLAVREQGPVESFESSLQHQVADNCASI